MSPEPVSPLRAKLQGEVLDAPWAELAPHHVRDALLVVAPQVDLLDVAVALAEDDVARVQGWLKSDQLARPAAETVATWREQDLRFQAVIVQPWVLAQALA